MRRYFVNKREKEIRKREEELIGKYYDDLQHKEFQQNNVPDKNNPYDGHAVYARILNRINRKAPRLRRFITGWRIAASVALLLCAGVIIYQYSGNVKQEGLEHKVTAHGETAELILEDGTKVWLNAGSELIYPGRFTGNTREITLSGEAYFEVTQDINRPFLIHSGEVITRVLGTTFNIKAYPDENDIAVSVVTGKVEVAAKPDKGINRVKKVYVTPEQQAIYRKNSRSLIHVRSPGHSDDAVAWKAGKMVYENKALAEIIADVERKYNVRITIPERLSTCSVSVDFDGEPLDFILNVLAELIQGEVKRRGSVYLLEGSGC